MRHLKLNLFGLLLLAFLALPGVALAQGYCTVASEKPKIVSGTTYTLSAADHCGFLVFTNTANPVAVTMPNAATTLPAGFKVWIKTQGTQTVTLSTPTVSLLDGTNAPSAGITTGTGVQVRSDGTDYYTSGLGIKHP